MASMKERLAALFRRLGGRLGIDREGRTVWVWLLPPCIGIVSAVLVAFMPGLPNDVGWVYRLPFAFFALLTMTAIASIYLITFDDLTRTTPTYVMTPWVVNELTAAGVKPENILFLGSFGTHRCMTADEIRIKLGKDIATKYAWMNHNAFDCLKEVGTTSRKNKILLNQTFMGADLKICLSGIKVHYDAEI